MCAAALAASAVSSMAQNVYSLNVVGYVNKSFTTGNYTLICNPLDAQTNDLNTIMPNVPDQTTIARWNTSLQDFDPATPTYFTATHTWIPNPTIKPGEGFFVVPSGNFTNTFVGNVLQGSNLTNPVPIVGGGSYVAVGSVIPLGVSLTNTLAGYAATDQDTLGLWKVSVQDFDPTTPTYFTATQTWIPDVNIAPGDGFFIIRSGAATTWVRSFTVQ